MNFSSRRVLLRVMDAAPRHRSNTVSGAQPFDRTSIAELNEKKSFSFTGAPQRPFGGLTVPPFAPGIKSTPNRRSSPPLSRISSRAPPTCS